MLCTQYVILMCHVEIKTDNCAQDIHKKEDEKKKNFNFH